MNSVNRCTVTVSGRTIRRKFRFPDPYRNLPGGVSPYPYLYEASNPRFVLPASIQGPSLDFVLPYTNLNAPATFGRIRGARNMREIQLGARLSF